MTMTKQEILEVLSMPWEQFEHEVMPKAEAVWCAQHGNVVDATAMLGFSNICKNQCLYCGMRAANTQVPRYRISASEVVETVKYAAEAAGFTRVFLVSGEDPKYGYDKLLEIVSALHAAGMRISLACGEYTAAQYAELAAAGCTEYVLKFEMSDKATFDRLNPSTTFEKRMAGIEAIQQSGMLLASGNIVGYPGQTLSQLAEDILLMQRLNISWAPVIPYMPAANTPLALEGGRGDPQLNLREIALLRLMMPDIDITAQQPGKELKNGLGDEQGNLSALRAGANLLFCDLLDDARAGAFRVIDNRNVTGTQHLYRVAQLAGRTLRL